MKPMKQNLRFMKLSAVYEQKERYNFDNPPTNPEKQNTTYYLSLSLSIS